MGNGLQKIAPFEIGYGCDGLPACGKYPAKPCGFLEDADRYICCAGSQIPGHLFYGWILCQKCHRRMPQRELEMLTILQNEGVDLSPDQTDRVRELESSKEAHQVRNRLMNRNKASEDHKKGVKPKNELGAKEVPKATPIDGTTAKRFTQKR